MVPSVRAAHIGAALLAAAVLAGCAQRPVLYPNSQYNQVGKAAADADVRACMQLAEAHGAQGDGVADAAVNTGAGAAIGAGAGAAVGAITGSAARGAGLGAVAGAAGGLLRSVLHSGRPSPAYRNFVDHCLRKRGYQPVGWQ